MTLRTAIWSIARGAASAAAESLRAASRALRRPAALALRAVLLLLLLGPLAIIAFLNVQPLCACAYGPSKTQVAREQVERLAGEAHTRWWLDHPGRGCPRDIGELTRHADNEDRDPWGTRLELVCIGAEIGIHVVSAGADSKFDTADDIVSSAER
jgi:hypothetical protein